MCEGGSSCEVKVPLLYKILITFVASFALQASLAAEWAFEANFNSDPAWPTQAGLPSDMDFVVTHRTHPRDHLSAELLSFPADHGPDCAGPPSQHSVTSSHLSNGSNPDQSFYVCKNHMMSALGEVSGYSVSAFYPRQDFDFSEGGVIEFETNMNVGHPRHWWEVMIVPRELLKVGAAEHFWPIDETYPSESILLSLLPDGKRKITLHSGATPPAGIIASSTDWRDWKFLNNETPDNDPQFDDRRRRHLHRIEVNANKITWWVEKLDGELDAFELNLPNGIPFNQGLVVLKTHAYTPNKDGNFDRLTVHWDEFRFDGPVVGKYDVIESPSLVYLQANGSRQVGENETQTLDIPSGTNLDRQPVLFGQVHNPMVGQVLLSINGGPNKVVSPYEYENGCNTSGWKSFRLPITPSDIHEGANELRWTIGPRPDCIESSIWNGFSIKGLELQLEHEIEAEPSNKRTVPIPFIVLGLFAAGLISLSFRRLQ